MKPEVKKFFVNYVNEGGGIIVFHDIPFNGKIVDVNLQTWNEKCQKTEDITKVALETFNPYKLTDIDINELPQDAIDELLMIAKKEY